MRIIIYSGLLVALAACSPKAENFDIEDQVDSTLASCDGSEIVQIHYYANSISSETALSVSSAVLSVFSRPVNFSWIDDRAPRFEVFGWDDARTCMLEAPTVRDAIAGVDGVNLGRSQCNCGPTNPVVGDNSGQ